MISINGMINNMGVKVPGRESFPRTFVAGSKSFRLVKVPVSESSASESSRERTGQSSIGTFAPGSELTQE